jgi:hypothetical protein
MTMMLGRKSPAHKPREPDPLLVALIVVAAAVIAIVLVIWQGS